MSKSGWFRAGCPVCCKGEPGCKAGQLVICGASDGGQQHFFGAPAVVVGVFAYLGCKVVREGVRVEVDEGAKQDTQLLDRDDRRGLCHDALERGLPLPA